MYSEGVAQIFSQMKQNWSHFSRQNIKVLTSRKEREYQIYNSWNSYMLNSAWNRVSYKTIDNTFLAAGNLSGVEMEEPKQKFWI